MEKNRSHVSDVLRLSNGRRRRRVSLTNLFPSILFFVVFFFCCVCVLFSFPRPIHANKSPGLESKRFRRTVASRGFFFVFVFFFLKFIFFLFFFVYFILSGTEKSLKEYLHEITLVWRPFPSIRSVAINSQFLDVANAIKSQSNQSLF